MAGRKNAKSYPGEGGRIFFDAGVRRKFFARLALTLALLATVAVTTGGGLGAYAASFYPDTEECIYLPTIVFPETVTISKDYLGVFKCAYPKDFNAGDFVSVWIEDMEGSPIKTVSKYAETNAGVEWVSPLSDSSGQAWAQIEIDPYSFDCNSTGKPYALKVSWDGNTTDLNFTVVCPTLTVEKYKTELPYWDVLHVEVLAVDNVGNRMPGIPCFAKVLNLNANEDYNAITIEQQTEEKLTDESGRVRFDFPSGLLTTLMQGYDYTTEITCLGSDVNFSFDVIDPNSQKLNNPLYNFMVFVGDNFVVLLFLTIVIIVVLAILGLAIHRGFGG